MPDVLAPGLQLVFCGINPGFRSAAAGAHFANPRNYFWRLLHDAGFTPRLYAPAEQHALLELGLGLTNAVRRITRGSGDLRRADFVGSANRLAELAQNLAPGGIAFVGKAAYEGTFRERRTGLQERRLAGAWLFVLPSTRPRTPPCATTSASCGSAPFERTSMASERPNDPRNSNRWGP